MQRTARKGQWTNRFDEIDRDRQLKQVLDTLENENSLLKTLVVRLSETIIRNAIAKR
jgi:membrane-anchored protein YejM (alkaline phosphatase superfamily)